MNKKMTSLILASALSLSCLFTSCSFVTGNSASDSILENSEELNMDYTLKLKTRYYYLEDGETQKLSYIFEIDGKKADSGLLSFSSDNESVAIVSDDGTITGVTEGKATISISIGEELVNATVFVKMRAKRISLSETSLELSIKDTKQVEAKAYYGTEQDMSATFIWESENSSVASVDTNGVITAVATGETNILVAYDNLVEKIHVKVVVGPTAAHINSFNEEYINIFGRTYVQSGTLHLDHVASAVEVGIEGTSLSVDLSGSADLYVRVFVDDEEIGERIYIPSTTKKYTLVDGLESGKHKIRIVNTSERTLKISSFDAEKFWVVPEKSALKVEFIGDSITAGYGVFGNSSESWSLSNSDGSNSYAYHAVKALGADYSIIACSGICVKGALAGRSLNMDTMYRRISNVNTNEYAFDFNPDVVVLNLGTNDGGCDRLAQFSEDYEAFLRYIRQKNPNAHIICLYGMMGNASTIDTGIRAALNNINDSKIVYNPFTIAANTQGADAHPTSSAQEAWGKTLADYIKTLI